EVTPGFFVAKATGWVNFGTRSISGPYEDEMSSEPWAGPAPTPVTPNDMGVFFKAFTGNATDGAAQGQLYQDVPVTTSGIGYTFSGWAGAEPNFSGLAVMSLMFFNSNDFITLNRELVLNNAELFTPNGQPFNYKKYSIGAIAPPDTVKIRARMMMNNGMANPAGGGQAFVVDDLSLVPEPSFLAIALPAGLVLLRRRRAS